MADKSVSAFARQVDLSEALIRKYLNGSEPSLSKARQISLNAGCSLQWLADGDEENKNADAASGSPADAGINHDALELALNLVQEITLQQELALQRQTKLIVATYQFLAVQRASGVSVNLQQARQFVAYLNTI